MPLLDDISKGARGLYASIVGEHISQPGVMYGPSMTRIGHTPLNFTKDTQDFTGGFYDPTLLNKGYIKVNPTTTDAGDVQAVIAHEDTHSILQKLDDSGQLTKMSQQNPYFAKIADELRKTRGGEMDAEVPAYMAAYSPTYSKTIPSTLRNLYTNYFQNQLQKTDPEAAAKYARIAAMNFQQNPLRISSPAYNIAQEANLGIEDYFGSKALVPHAPGYRAPEHR